MPRTMHPETICVQAGWNPRKGEPRVLPVYQSTTFKYDTSNQMARLFDLEDTGYFYTRLQNPTNDAVAAKIAALEGGVGAMLTSSGQAANFYAVFNICKAGDHFVSSSAIYGGTFNLFAVTLKQLGIDVTFVDPDASAADIAAAFRPETKALFGETISNPSMEVLDIEKFAGIAHSHGVPLIVDNTFPTPINCRPIEWGQILWCIPLLNIWTAMPRAWVARLWTAATSRGWNTLTNFLVCVLLMPRITVLHMPKHLVNLPILPKLRYILCAIWAAYRVRTMHFFSTSAWKRCICVCRAIVPRLWPWRSILSIIPRWPGWNMPGLKPVRIISSPANICHQAPAACCRSV